MRSIKAVLMNGLYMSFWEEIALNGLCVPHEHVPRVSNRKELKTGSITTQMKQHLMTSCKYEGINGKEQRDTWTIWKYTWVFGCSAHVAMFIQMMTPKIYLWNEILHWLNNLRITRVNLQKILCGTVKYTKS